MKGLALVLALADLLLAVGTLLLWARPEAALPLISRLLGVGEQWEQGELGFEEEARLLRLVHLARWPVLLSLAALSFCAGLALTLARL